MKHYNQKHRVELNSQLKSNCRKEDKPEDGEIVPHQQKVQYIMFYEPAKSTIGDFYIEVWMQREKILDLADQIREIESQTIMAPYNTLPF